MADWDSEQYLKFGDQRTQPARDLASRLAGLSPRSAADIGCGPGNSTAVLKSFFPDADVIGIDSSPDMTAKARASYPELKFRLCDVWSLDGTFDLLFSNACLQWVPDHRSLIPFLMNRLNDGGELAVQIPMNDEEPLFGIIRQTVADPAWGLDDVQTAHSRPVLSPSDYYDILSGCSVRFDMWQTKYYHRLDGHKSLLEWVKGTRLRPYLDAMDAGRAQDFEAEILRRTEAAYPLLCDGGVMLCFRRFFFIARK